MITQQKQSQEFLDLIVPYLVKTKGQEIVDAIKEIRNERRRNRSWCEMIESTNPSSHPTSEIVAYIMEKEKPDELRICEFKGQNFELVSGQLLSTRNELINKIKRSELIEPTLLLLLP